MSRDAIVLYILSAAALCFGLINALQFLFLHSKTAQTVGTVVSIKMPNPETAKTRNSKWAVVSYTVNGKVYHSQNRIQVPMSSQVGSQVKVRYDRSAPQRLYSFSILRAAGSLLIAAFCLFLALGPARHGL